MVMLDAWVTLRKCARMFDKEAPWQSLLPTTKAGKSRSSCLRSFWSSVETQSWKADAEFP